MQPLIIHLSNGIWLVLVLIGIPSVTSMEFGALTVSSAPDARMLTFGGLGMAVAGNVLGGVWLARGRKSRGLCFRWAAGFGGLLLVQLLIVSGFIHFRWLKDLLLQLRAWGG